MWVLWKHLLQTSRSRCRLGWFLGVTSGMHPPKMKNNLQYGEQILYHFSPPQWRLWWVFTKLPPSSPSSKPPLKWAFLTKVNLMHYFVDHFPAIICIVWVFFWSWQCKLGPVWHSVQDYWLRCHLCVIMWSLYVLGCQYPLAHGQSIASCSSRYAGKSWLQDWWWRHSDQHRLHVACFLVCFRQVMRPMPYLVWLCLLYTSVCLGLNFSFLTLIALGPWSNTLLPMWEN